jgi:hypothetical protein
MIGFGSRKMGRGLKSTSAQIGSTYATVGIYEAIGGPEPQKLEFREVADQLQDAFYQKQEELKGTIPQGNSPDIDESLG